jgi:hypothetical protein
MWQQWIQRVMDENDMLYNVIEFAYVHFVHGLPLFISIVSFGVPASISEIAVSKGKMRSTIGGIPMAGLSSLAVHGFIRKVGWTWVSSVAFSLNAVICIDELMGI